MCKITAPEPEPQRGTVIQTDDKGRIATTPIGTPDRPVSRIISRDEFRDMQDTSQGRSFEQAQEDLSPEQKMLALSRQPTTPVGIRSFGPPSKRIIDSIRDRFDNTLDFTDKPKYKRFEPSLHQTPILKPNIFRNIDPDDLRFEDDVEGVDIPMPMQKPDRRSGVTGLNFTDEPKYKRFVNQYNEDDYEMRNNAAMFQPVDPRRFNRRPGFLERMASRMTPDYEAAFGEKPISDETNINKRMMMERSDQSVVEAFYNPETQTYTFLDPSQQRATSDVAGPEVQQFAYDSESDTYFNVKPEFPQSGNFGYKVDVDNAMFDLAGDTGIMSLKERGKDLQKGFEAAYGVNVPNDPVKAMQARINDPQYQDFLKAQDSIFAGAANRLGKFMGYDDPFELYKATQAQKERSKQADIMRRRDQDRAMQSQAKQPFDPCPPGYKYDPAQKQCVPVAKEEDETEMGQKFVRNPVAFTGDPNMYGRTGGEYQFFTEVPGLIKAANGIPRGPTGEIRGVGGPKDDLVGPFMLSDQEYVLPKEMVMAAGGGNYDTGIKKLENMRKNSLNKYGDYV